MTPLISIVTGTFGRLNLLKAMMTSIRQQLPKGIGYEFVVIDGGSTDGTLEYLRQQADVVLIEHGELRGAIKAFCDGARAASGEYVILANDDVLFRPGSILRAVVHLETHPSCAAVAFADNRTSLVTGDGKDYRTEGAGCTLPDGTTSMVTYAQVGMFRRELGNEAGWWGDTDPVFGKAYTYGGDNYLSARLWEAGYTVDPVAGCVIEDMIARDELRTVSQERSGNDSRLYYERFPTIRIPADRKQYPVPDRLRILYLPVYEAGHPQAENKERGLTDGFAAYGLVAEVDYLNETVDLPKFAGIWQPDLILTQIQGAGEKLSPAILAGMRAAAPGAVVVNWNGDAHVEGLLGEHVLSLLEHVDLQTTVNAAVLPEYERLGIRADYWQIHFAQPIEPYPEMPTHDVVCQMNCYNARRTEMAKMLTSLPYNVGVYGNCGQYTVGSTHYSFEKQAALNQQAAIVVGDTFPGTVGFVSNRMLQVLGVGGFLLNEVSPELETYTGFVDGVHYVAWYDLDDLKRLIEFYMQHPEDRKRIAEAGREYVLANYTPERQVEKLFRLLQGG